MLSVSIGRLFRLSIQLSSTVLLVLSCGSEWGFQQGLGYLKAYREHHGDCMVPQRFKSKDGFTHSKDKDAFNLGVWASNLCHDKVELAPRGGRFWTRDSSGGGVLLLVVERGHLAEG